jgi:hypothetical protein
MVERAELSIESELGISPATAFSARWKPAPAPSQQLRRWAGAR